MAGTDYVTVNVAQNTVALQKPGFGTALYVSYVAAWTERTRLYSQYTDVLADFPNTTGPEARIAAAYFGQTPSAAQLMIGRGANKATKVLSLSAVAPTGALNYTYSLLVRGDGFADATVTYTSDGTPTDAEFAAGIVTALNAVAGKNYTAAGASSPVTITGNAAGNWFSVAATDVTHTTITETTADPGIAADLTAITAENPNWFLLLTAFNSKAYGVAAAAAVEAGATRVYLAGTSDSSTVVNASSGTADLMDQAKTNAYSRTMVQYHPLAAQFADAALAGAKLWTTPGSEDWMFMPLNGISSFAMTATQRANIVARNGNSTELAFGVNVTFNGMMANGGFMDTRRFLDWLKSTIALMVFGSFVAASKAGSKIPMTDPGIAVIETQTRAALELGVDSGGLIRSTIVVTVPTAASLPSADVTSRTLNNVKFTATTQGSQHKVNIVGTVSGS